MSHLCIEMNYPNKITVLGPVTIDSATVTPRQRALIAALVLNNANGATTDALADAIWGRRTPESARASIQNQVARLRNTFGADLIKTREDRYFVAATTDADQFETLITPWLNQPPSGRAVPVLGSALDLWRGTPFEDIHDHFAASIERARLEHIRGLAIESYTLALLTQGQLGNAIGELSVRTVAAPFHERAWGLLMISLYESGRRTEALQAYGRFADLLHAELAAEPSAALKRLRQAVALDEPLDVRESLDVRATATSRPLIALATA